jgi:hypothetical protein
MVKFLVALAELFSSFSAKLHDMSEDAKVADTFTTDLVKDMIDDAIGNAQVKAEDVKGLRRFVDGIVEDQSLDTSDIDGLEDFVMGCIPNSEDLYSAHIRRQKCLEVIVQYSEKYNLHHKINLDNEIERLNRHMLDRITVWASIDPKI